MRACERRIGRVLSTGVMVVLLSQAAYAGYVAAAWDYAATDAAPSGMESVFGTKVAQLDAKAYGFNFLFKRDGSAQGYDDPFHGHRNLNVISEVFVATQAVTIGTGNGGSTIDLQPGDYTFAYTLDYTQIDGILVDSAVRDFQILRTIAGVTPPVSNPGPHVAVDEVKAGAYNTNAAYGGGGGGTPPLLPYPDGLGYEAYDFGTVILDKMEYDWGADVVEAETKAMVLLFASPNVQIWQVGWGSQNGMPLATMAEREAVGHTGEGGSTLGGGESIPDSIPVLIPVIPEPVTLALLCVGSLALAKRRMRV